LKKTLYLGYVQFERKITMEKRTKSLGTRNRSRGKKEPNAIRWITLPRGLESTYGHSKGNPGY